MSMDFAALAAQLVLASQSEDQRRMLLASFRSSTRIKLMTDAHWIWMIRPSGGVPLELMPPDVMSLEPENTDSVDQTAPS